MIQALKSLCEYSLGDDWQHAMALLEVESGGNELAVGDGGRSRGLWQMHADFIATFLPHFGENGLALAVGAHDPFIQADALRRFWHAFPPETPAAERYRVFHYGANGAARLAKSDDPDPDGYVPKVQKRYAKNTGTTPQPTPAAASND